MDRLIAPFLTWAGSLGIQAFILRDAIWLGGWISPAFHLYGLLLLPLSWSPLALLLAGGMTGVLLDLATAQAGVWTSSGLLFGALLPVVNRLLSPREGYETDSTPTWKDQGLGWFIARTLLLLIAHDLWRFGLEAGRWGLRWQLAPMALTSALSTGLLILLINRLLTQNSMRR